MAEIPLGVLLLLRQPRGLGLLAARTESGAPGGRSAPGLPGHRALLPRPRAPRGCGARGAAWGESRRERPRDVGRRRAGGKRQEEAGFLPFVCWSSARSLPPEQPCGQTPGPSELSGKRRGAAGRGGDRPRPRGGL